ncbi:MAG: HlyC/CorC family transporter [Proteobacteria bacterium]|nr:HlyC/CorC family transporter [Pseudomonadota bacterium]
MSDPSLRSTPRENGADEESSLTRTIRRWLRSLGVGRADGTLQDNLRELLEQHEEDSHQVNAEERMILMNLVKLGELRVGDVMIPRADIIGVEDTAGIDKLVRVFRDGLHSRLPVFRGTLDNVIGMVHIKDLLAYWGAGEGFDLLKLVREVEFVPPSMPVLDLLLKMRTLRVHMAMVIDEFGGTDGLATIEDLVEAIVGEIEDEHDVEERAPFVEVSEGVFDADARAPIEEVEARMRCDFLPEDRDEDIDTIGGVVTSLAGRVPQRGEIIAHPSGIEFEITEADARRVKRLRVRRVKPAAGATSADVKDVSEAG